VVKKNKKTAGLVRTLPVILSNQPSMASTMKEHPSGTTSCQPVTHKIVTEPRPTCGQLVSSLTFTPGLMYCNTGPNVVKGLSSYDKDDLMFHYAAVIPNDLTYESMNINIKVNNDNDVFYDALELVPEGEVNSQMCSSSILWNQMLMVLELIVLLQWDYRTITNIGLLLLIIKNGYHCLCKSFSRMFSQKNA
jgi:hypothetical protein